MNNIDELAAASDLSEAAVSQAIHQLFKMRGLSNKQEEAVHIFLVCSGGAVLEATNATEKIVKAFNETSSEVEVSINYVGFLDVFAWFITDGTHLVFTPGA